jgi:hypothetical protein
MFLCAGRPHVMNVDLTVKKQVVVLCIDTPRITCRLQVRLENAIAVGYVPLEFSCSSLFTIMKLVYNTTDGTRLFETEITAVPDTFISKWIPIKPHKHIDQSLCCYNIGVTISLVVDEPPLSEVEKILAEEYGDDLF